MWPECRPTNYSTAAAGWNTDLETKTTFLGRSWTRSGHSFSALKKTPFVKLKKYSLVASYIQ